MEGWIPALFITRSSESRSAQCKIPEIPIVRSKDERKCEDRKAHEEEHEAEAHDVSCAQTHQSKERKTPKGLIHVSEHVPVRDGHRDLAVRHAQRLRRLEHRWALDGPFPGARGNEALREDRSQKGEDG